MSKILVLNWPKTLLAHQNLQKSFTAKEFFVLKIKAVKKTSVNVAKNALGC